MKNTTAIVKTTTNEKGAKTMTKTEYAQRIAQSIDGARVENVEKANGVIMTAVSLPTVSGNIRANFYIDDLYKDDVDLEDAIDKAREVASRKEPATIDIDWIYDFEKVRPHLKARLYNKLTSADVFRSADVYGFDDLIITAHIEDAIKDGSIKVTRELVKVWNMTPEEVLDIAEDNARNDAVIQSMTDILRAMGMPLPVTLEDPMTVVTNERKTYGAYAVIAKLDELKARFKNGFTVLPSSVHEVIIVDNGDTSAYTSMVQEVNDSEVDPTEQLSNHAYVIAA